VEFGYLVDDRYEIASLLGQGGMAHVYRAHDRHLDRDVALKILRPHLTELDQERFRREIKALARFSHPGIVSIYDLGRGAHVYFAMELVEGGIFTDLGPLEPDLEPFSKFIQAAVSVAEALAYVHRHGMVHRDLTPRNILLTPEGQPKVMDFGLVQLAEVSRELTRTGFTLGTPQYMAPEQAKGDPTGAHTDLYSLGAVLYRTVTGVAPFEAENDQAVLFQHVYGEVVPPHRLNPNVPEDLSMLIESLLVKDPAARPASAALVADALRSVQAEVEALSASQRAGGPAQQGLLAHGPANPSRLKERWSLQLAEGPQWPAALTAAKGFLLVGLRSEEVSVLHPADGGVQARFHASDEVNSPVVWQHDNLYYASRDGGLYALRWPSGEPHWEDREAGVVGTAVPFEGGLLISSHQGTIEKRRYTGELEWSYGAGEAFATAPLCHRGEVFAVTRSGWLHGVEARSAKGRFKAHIGEVVCQPAASSGILVLPERAGDLHAFSLITREALWSYDTEGELWASPLVWGPYVYVASWSGMMRCLSLKSGDDVWSFDVGARVTAAPVIAAGALYAVSEGGELFTFDARAGKLLFRERLSAGPIQASPVILGDTVVVAAVDGMVRAYS
jgi:eukaryotic-like serine/threonine-protein kinase